MAEANVRQPEHSVIETLQSLIVAFVLAMTFRGFVTEGFVIPTGSMAPTLLGQHKRLHAKETGWDFSVGYDPRLGQVDLSRVPDPMLGPMYPGEGTSKSRSRTKMGDRILVLKSLYPFFEPDRFDVVVFKNPTNPNGEDGNYIKRLIGLPSEAIWLVDGDVFAAPIDAADDPGAFVVQRKPEHVQRAVWQPIFHSDYQPLRPENLDRPYLGSPWRGDGWRTDQASFRCDTTGPTELEWDNHVRVVDDWAPYNVIVRSSRRQPRVHVSDIRIGTAIVPDEEGLTTTLRIDVRGHQLEYILDGQTARLRMRSAAYEDDFPDDGWTSTEPAPIDAFHAGRPTNVEFWHVDQMMALFVDGERVCELPYDWAPVARLEHATGRLGLEVDELASLMPNTTPMIRWRFAGSAVTLERTRLDRDLYYRQDAVNEFTRKNPALPANEQSVASGLHAYGTHPDNIARLGPDHFFMAGDNSAASSDSRLWGSPHPLVATQIDPVPFLVNRKLLLGKAWVVYFPAPHSISENGKAFIPDFGALRFIR